MTDATVHFFRVPATCAARARLEEAEQYYLAGNLNEALAAAQQAWREQPREPDVFRVLAYLHMARGEYAPAAQAAYQAVTLDGEHALSYALLAQVYLTFNMHAKADETLTLAKQHFPDDPSLLTLLADLRFRQRRDREGEEVAIRALAANPEDGYTKALLAASHLRHRRFDAAARLFADAVTQYPQRWDYQRDLGAALLRTGAYDRARTALLEARRLNPDEHTIARLLYWALTLSPHATGFGKLAFFFFTHPGLGWLLNLCGLIAGIVGAVVLIMLIATRTMDPTVTLQWGIPLFGGGLALVIGTQSGVMLHSISVRKLEYLLRRLLAREQHLNAPATERPRP